MHTALFSFIMLTCLQNAIIGIIMMLCTVQAASGHETKVRISKEVHPKIIGKGGAQIRKIRDETDTRIDFPRENSDSDVITITGKKENVEKAKNMIEAIEKETVCISIFYFCFSSQVYRLYARRTGTCAWYKMLE